MTAHVDLEEALKVLDERQEGLLARTRAIVARSEVGPLDVADLAFLDQMRAETFETLATLWTILGRLNNDEGADAELA